MLTLILRFVIMWFSMINVVFLFFRKSFIYFNNLFEIFFFFMLWRKWKCDTLSKTSLTFKLRNDIIFFFCSFYIVWIFFVMNCKIVFINRCLRAFIWMFESVFSASTTYRMYLNTIDFNILFNVFNNAIDLYDENFA